MLFGAKKHRETAEEIEVFVTGREHGKRKSIGRGMLLLGAGAGIVILLILGFLLQPEYGVDAQTKAYIKEAIRKQEQIERSLQSYYEAGEYSFEEPLVVQDPYKTAPLTALVIFDTAEESRISVHVDGRSSQAEVDYTFPGYWKHHEIPVYGLYAGSMNLVTLEMELKSGETSQHVIDLQTEPLPETIPDLQIDKMIPDQVSPGFNFTFTNQKAVLDPDGFVRWYSMRISAQIFTKLENGRYLFTYSIGTQKERAIFEEDLLGKIHAIFYIADGIHHEIYELPDRNLLVTSSDLKSKTVEDYLLELDRKNGRFIRLIDLKKYLDPNRPGEIGMEPNDWLHLNSIVYDPTDRSIILSSRAQSAVVKMSYPGMQIKWILGSHDNWSEKYQAYLLTPLGENFEWPWSQHHATIINRREPGEKILNLLLFDNGQYRSFDLSSATSPAEWYSRVVHYRIDEEAMTVEQVWAYGEERGAAIFSESLGSAYFLPNGDVFGTWNAADTTRLIEVKPSNNQVVFEGTLSSDTYRTMRNGFYDGYSEGNAILSSPLEDHSENGLFNRSVLAWRDLQRWTDPTQLSLEARRVLRRWIAIVK